jgi:hypothetical protein
MAQNCEGKATHCMYFMRLKLLRHFPVSVTGLSTHLSFSASMAAMQAARRQWHGLQQNPHCLPVVQLVIAPQLAAPNTHAVQLAPAILFCCQ